MLVRIALPGTTAKWHCGGLFIALDAAERLAQHCSVEIVTYADREESRPFLDDLLAAPSAADEGLWVITWGPDLARLIDRLDGRRVVVYSQSSGWDVQLPAGVAVLALSRYLMAYWGTRTARNAIFHLPPVLRESCSNRGLARDIDVLYLSRKTSKYLHESLVPALEQRCRVERVDTMLPHEELMTLFNRSRVYLYDPALTFTDGLVEGFGLQPLEAIVCGAAVFSSVQGGLADYLDPGLNSEPLSHDVERDVAAVMERLREGGASSEEAEALRERYSAARWHERVARILPRLDGYTSHMNAADRSDDEAPNRISRVHALEEEIRKRDESVWELKRVMEHQVALRDESVRALQKQLEQETAARDAIIRQLQEQLRGSR